MVRSNVFLTKPAGINDKLASWFAFFIVGVLMGTSAFLVDIIAEGLVLYKWKITQVALNGNAGLGWFTFLVFSLIFGAGAAILTVFIGPGAAGGGTAELMGYFNGINYPGLIGFRTLFVKIVGLGLAVASGLCIGKEGPLAHIGAIVGHLVIYLPLPYMPYFRNDKDKREIAAAGVAAGVSAAFGSPIGGSLFAYEISRPSTFWSFGLTWKIFFCSSISTFILNILNSIKHGQSVLIFNGGLIKFGSYDEHPYKLHDFPFFLILGMLGGLLGAFFIFVNYSINKLRKKYLKTSWKKVCETLVLVFFTSTVIYFAPMLLNNDCLV